MRAGAYLNPLAMTRSLWAHRDLIIQLAQRSFTSRYKGSVLGVAWSFITPLIALVTYALVFGYIFHSRWSRDSGGSQIEFALTLFSGMIPFAFFSELINRSPMLIVGVPNLVKKVVFPLETISVSEALAGLVHMSVSLLILIVLCAVVRGQFHWTLLCLPLGIVPLVFLSLGLSWWLASMGAFLRDIGHTVALVVNLLFFLTPIFYDLNADGIPVLLRSLLRLNPLASIVDLFRRSILWGMPPQWPSLLYALALSVLVLMAGYVWFMKSRKAFSDVL
jgi:lipopolysaccharide transport system permease protein